MRNAPNTASLWVYLRIWLSGPDGASVLHSVVFRFGFCPLGSSAGGPSDSSELRFLHCGLQRRKDLGKKIQWDQVTGTIGIKSSSGHFCPLE